MKIYFPTCFILASLYVKVTLFEGQTVIKAKKTRSVPVYSKGEEVTFYETFTILFPYDFLQEVSCIISLCGRTKKGMVTARIPV